MPIMDLIAKAKTNLRRRERNKSLKTAALGAAVGVTMGVAAGVLLAPKAGEETRKDLAIAAKGLPGKAREIMTQTREKVAEISGRLKANAAEDAGDVDPK